MIDNLTCIWVLIQGFEQPILSDFNGISRIPSSSLIFHLSLQFYSRIFRNHNFPKLLKLCEILSVFKPLHTVDILLVKQLRLFTSTSVQTSYIKFINLKTFVWISIKGEALNEIAPEEIQVEKTACKSDLAFQRYHIKVEVYTSEYKPSYVPD